ncbi:zinc-ribbon domain-containing protein [Methanobacterium sp.]|uniref:zinc-ribbon domain-containing protein n=1 Tax=Methanobacterium sp. TaxID=2164 RepID=UPI003C70DF6D
MVSNEEIKRRLELRRRGINPDEELNKRDEVICSKCQTVNLENAKFCIGCGNELNKLPVYTLKINESKSNMIICPECGTENKLNSKFCIGCGSNLLETSVNTHDANKIENSSICPECSFENNSSSKFCISCGSSLKEVPNENRNSFNTETDEKEVQLIIKEGMDEQEVPLGTENVPDNEMSDVQEQNDEVNILDEIKKAKELLDMGAISEEEYEKIKSRYIDLLN